MNTLAPKSIDVLHAPGVDLRPDTVTEGVEDAHRVLTDLEAAGVSFADVTETIEREASPPSRPRTTTCSRPHQARRRANLTRVFSWFSGS